MTRLSKRMALSFRAKEFRKENLFKNKYSEVEYFYFGIMSEGKQAVRRIMGIDPGTNVLGFAVIEVIGKKTKLIDLDAMYMTHLKDHHAKIAQIFKEVRLLLMKHNIQELALEAPFFGKNVQSMLKLGRAQGVSMAAGISLNIPLAEYAPKQVKMAVTGNGNSSKEQVAAMLETILRVKFEGKSLDATDALAVAICHQQRAGKGSMKEKKYSGWGSFIKENPGRAKKK